MAKTEALEVEVGGRTVRLTNPDKVYWPEVGVTKRELFDHYVAVGPGILRALRERPVTLERWPKGVHPGMVLATRERPNDGDGFYQKRVMKGAPA